VPTELPRRRLLRTSHGLPAAPTAGCGFDVACGPVFWR